MARRHRMVPIHSPPSFRWVLSRLMLPTHLMVQRVRSRRSNPSVHWVLRVLTPPRPQKVRSLLSFLWGRSRLTCPAHPKVQRDRSHLDLPRVHSVPTAPTRLKIREARSLLSCQLVHWCLMIRMYQKVRKAHSVPIHLATQ